MSTFSALKDELDLWHQSGERATFWWRDDDLNEPTAAFDRLLSLREQLDIPLSLAVIPDRVDPLIGEDLEGCLLLQHGVTHQNFAEKGEKKSEFPSTRAKADALSDLLSGKSRMEELFGEDFLPFLVPPWNRISDALFNDLAENGFMGISRYNARRQAYPVQKFVEINTHIDPVFWRANRSAVSESKILGMVLVHLKARRTGFADQTEPTGFLSHHLVYDEALWEVTFKLLDFLKRHEAVRWMTLPGAMALMNDF